MSRDSDEQTIRVARIGGDIWNLLPVTKAEMRPRLSRVGRLVDSVAHGEIGARESFAGADVQHVGVGRGDRERSNRSGRLIVENRLPGATGIGRLPDAAVADAYIEGVRLAWMPDSRLRPAAAEWPDRAPLHV